MATCEVCDGDMPDGAVACPHCGSRLAASGEVRHRWVRITIFVVLLVAVMVAWSWSTRFSARPG
jgi:predicted nucleic acid-binding Zn ribbon protein